ncbi:Membrane protease subunit, stomatin/prohibitin family, contains C-terminal Zn-ribbon domain [Hathewaya proteolytica DSM 3090]|uniref:Membrane protease subunit, stomatin/prohibitin family, contains C-terminal Zn-ribbon domain n=1 Tax=Hathewaya proteolytica DSM 3090 TaxID=1121331 RepID=A0A1M6JNL1_9CLOT|nr:SPFH domain-containing protein [Hathewaya proteolytica]SHJ48335.1 Membrane protease subunit, stomatin/prohibitin family, contains C-terminal Zn-ribbon domain [Hathewaya proteolytica DSM 3090]
MGLFDRQLANIVEWNETNEDMIFWKWSNNELKKGSRLIIRPGQDAIFLYNGVIEGIFKEEGNYEIESEIIPFLSTLKGFKFGFKNSLRAEVVFVNTKEFTVKWGTKNPLNIPAPGMRGGMPIRCFGTYRFRIEDYVCFIEKIAGIKQQYCVDDVKQTSGTILDQLIMKWLIREGKDMFNLQAYSTEICSGIMKDLNEELLRIGIMVTSLNIENFSYPESVQKMIDKNAAYGMVNADANYQTVSMLENMDKNPSSGNNAMGNMASGMANMAQMGMGMRMGMNMMDSMEKTYNNTYNNQNPSSKSNGNQEANGGSNNVCSKCHANVEPGAKFCPNCGNKIEEKPMIAAGSKFCTNCGAKVEANAKFCPECGTKVN